MPIKTIAPNYYVVPCEIGIRAKVIPDPNQRGLPSDFWTTGFSDLVGVNNFSLNFTLNSGVFRGVGDCVNIRRPTSWEGTLDLTRFISSANWARDNNTGLTSLYRLINQGTPANGYMFGTQHSWNTTIGVVIFIPNVSKTKNLRLGLAGLVSSASFSVERDRVEENISLRTHANGTLISQLV